MSLSEVKFYKILIMIMTNFRSVAFRMRFPAKLQLILYIVTSNVSGQRWKCGDRRLLRSEMCECGDKTISFNDYVEKRVYCCESQNNSRLIRWSDACVGTCNDDPYYPSNKCSSGDKCVYYGDVCQGYKHYCSDNKDDCSEEKLKCPEYDIWRKCDPVQGTSMCFNSRKI